MAEIPAIPKTLREAVIAIWYKINDGLSKEISETHALALDTAGRMQKIEAVVPTLWTREQHENMHAEYVAELEAKEKEKQEHGERQKMSRRDVLMLVLVGLGLAVSTLFSLLMYLKGL